MSKAFTKEDDGTENIHLDDLPQSTHPNLVTASGLKSLKARHDARRADLAKLRAQPDDFDSKMAIAIAERDIRFFEGRINRAILVAHPDDDLDTVVFGAEVDFLTADGTRQTFRIVGEDEADPTQGLIAHFSPLGAALLGAKLGSFVEWTKPTGVVELEIVAIRLAK